MQSIRHLLGQIKTAHDLEVTVMKLPSPETSQALEALQSGKILILVLNELDADAAQRFVNSVADTGTIDEPQWLGEQTFLFAPGCPHSAKQKPKREFCYGDAPKRGEPEDAISALLNIVDNQHAEVPIRQKAAAILGTMGAGAIAAKPRLLKVLENSHQPIPIRQSAWQAFREIESNAVAVATSPLHLKLFETWIEDVGDILEMVLLPGGTFMMGSPETEKERSQDESPQHTVAIAPFSIGKYPVTQSQWQAVAALTPVERSLHPNPSSFQGSHLPVEQVTWYDAVEFCARLSQKTGRQYRLPSEAEWEYACRAGTTTPFANNINSNVANYDGRSTYGSESPGAYRQQTTPVGSLGKVNAFGLSDLHGNVWEWCADHWHDNYQQAPTDGSVWLSKHEDHSRVVRGGSWYDQPRFCRSACRYGYKPSSKNNDLGFRIVCDGAGTPS